MLNANSGGWYHISGVIVSVLAHIIVDYNMGIFCFLAKHAALSRKNKDWMARNQDNVSEWGDMYIRELLFHGALDNCRLLL
jgi:hypothetical protein